MAALNEYSVLITGNAFTGMLKATTSWGFRYEVKTKLSAESPKVKSFTRVVNDLTGQHYTPTELINLLSQDGAIKIAVDPKKVEFKC